MNYLRTITEHRGRTGLENFRAPFYSLQDISKETEEFRKKYWDLNKFPVDVLKIAEQTLKLDVVPVEKLSKVSTVVAFISYDMKTIYVDLEMYLDERYQNRLRFSIAHELAHYWLHKNLYKELQFQTINEYISIIEKIPADQYRFIEFHANEFAGNLLVPTEELIQSLNRNRKYFQDIMEFIGDVDSFILANFLPEEVCTDFGVSTQVINKRIAREKINLIKLMGGG